MSLWTKTDGAAGKPLNLTTAEKADVFGVDATEIALRTGVFTGLTQFTKGSGYVSAPTVTITGVEVVGIDAVADVDATLEDITATDHPFVDGDEVRYSNGGGTSIGGLVDGNNFFIITATTNTFQLSLTLGGAAIDLVDGIGVAHEFTIGDLAAATAVRTVGKILSYIVDTAGDGRYQKGKITIAVAAPAAVVIAAADITGNVITETAHVFATGDRLTYNDGTGTLDTALTDGVVFFVIKLTANTFSLATTASNAANAIALVLAGDGTGTDHTLTGETATAKEILQTSTEGVAHTGWVKRTVGSGGRAGRVQYEVLVAGSITGDDTDDAIFPEA